jgi:hypothetical protein
MEREAETPSKKAQGEEGESPTKEPREAGPEGVVAIEPLEYYDYPGCQEMPVLSCSTTEDALGKWVQQLRKVLSPGAQVHVNAPPALEGSPLIVTPHQIVRFVLERHPSVSWFQLRVWTTPVPAPGSQPQGRPLVTEWQTHKGGLSPLHMHVMLTRSGGARARSQDFRWIELSLSVFSHSGESNEKFVYSDGSLVSREPPSACEDCGCMACEC